MTKDAQAWRLFSGIPSELWDRQPGEPPRGWHAFTHYRNLGVYRSLARAHQEHQGICGRVWGGRGRDLKDWKQLSRRWGWVDRAAAWDASLDAMCLQAAAADQVEVRSRHARLAQGALEVMTLPVRATLEALADPAVLRSLIDRVSRDPDALLELLQVVARCASSIPDLINVERRALGMTDRPADVGPWRESRFATRIAADPKAIELAVALLDQIAGSDPEQEGIIS